MKYDVEQAKYILGLISKDYNVNYDFKHMKHEISLIMGEPFYREFYDNEIEFNKLVNLFQKIVEINIWHLHNIRISISNNELVIYNNNQKINKEDIFSIHEEDKKQVIQHTVNRINEINAKSKRTSNLIVEYNNIVASNDKVKKDINDLKEMNNSFTGKFGIFKLKNKNMINFSSDITTPNRDKKTEDLYDTLRIIRTNEDNYKNVIMKYFLDIKSNIERGIVYLFDYNKFKGSFTACDLFLLNKVIDIINTIIDNTDNIVSSNKILISKQTKELKNITDEIKNSNFMSIISNINNYTIPNIETMDFKDINYSIIEPDNTLKYIIKMYEDIKYII